MTHNLKITVATDGRVDFEAPIYVTDTQRKEILSFFEELFPGEVQTKSQVTCFFAYPLSPPSLAESIELAINQMNQAGQNLDFL